MENERPDKAEEPQIAYGKKRLTFFTSHEEMEEDRYRMLASLSYEERLMNLEKMRKSIYHNELLPNGEWPPMSKKFTIIKLPDDWLK